MDVWLNCDLAIDQIGLLPLNSVHTHCTCPQRKCDLRKCAAYDSACFGCRSATGIKTTRTRFAPLSNTSPANLVLRVLSSHPSPPDYSVKLLLQEQMEQQRSLLWEWLNLLTALLQELWRFALTNLAFVISLDAH